MSFFSRRSAGRPPANGIDAKTKTGISLDPDIAARLAQEDNKSGLINELLRKHYSMPEFSRRLVHSFELLNQGCQQHNKLSVSKIASMLNLEKAGILQRYFDGIDEPNFQFLDAYADLFGIFPNWLKFGEGSPFFSREPMCLYSTDYLIKIREVSPEAVYFIRANSDAGESGILLKLSDFKFTYFPKTWPISSHVGSTGQSQIFEFYQTIIALQAVTPSVRCQGRIIDETDFWDLFCGRAFAGSVIERHENQWWDDFTDIYREDTYAVDYEESYGKEFLKAQDIVKYLLEKTSSKSESD